MASLLPEGENSMFLEFSNQTWTLSSADLNSTSGEEGKDMKEKGRLSPYDPDMDVNDDNDDDPTVGETGVKVTVLPQRRNLPSSAFLGGTEKRIPPDHGPSTDTTSTKLRAVVRRSSSTNSCSDVHTVVTESSNTIPSFSFEIDLPTPVEISPLSWKESIFKDRRNRDGHDEKLSIPPLEAIHHTGRDEPANDRTRSDRIRPHSKSLLARKDERKLLLLTRSQSLFEDPSTSKYSLRVDHSNSRRIRSRSDSRTTTEDPTIPATTTTTKAKAKATTRSSTLKPQPHSLLKTGARSDVRRKGRHSRGRSLSSERGETKGAKGRKGSSSSGAHTERNREKSDEMQRSMSPAKLYRKSINHGDSRSLAPFRAHSMSATSSKRSSRDIYTETSTSTRSQKSSTRFRKSDTSDRMSRTSGMSNNVRSRKSVSPAKSQRSFHAITPSPHRRQLSSSNIQGQHSLRATRPLDSRQSLRSRKWSTSMLNVEAETKEIKIGEGHFHILKSVDNGPKVEPQDSSMAATPDFISPKATLVHTTPLSSSSTTKREQAGSKFWSVLSPGGISVDAQVKRANELIQRQKLKKEKSRLRRLSLDQFGEPNQSITVVQKENDEMASMPEAMELARSRSSRNVFAALSRRFSKLSTGPQAGTVTKGPHSETAGQFVEDAHQKYASTSGNPNATGQHQVSHFVSSNDEAFNESAAARTSSPTRWSPRKAAKWMTRKGHEIATNATGRSEQRRILLDDNEED